MELLRCFFVGLVGSFSLFSGFFDPRENLGNLELMLRKRVWFDLDGVVLVLAVSNGSACRNDGVGEFELCSLRGGVYTFDIVGLGVLKIDALRFEEKYEALKGESSVGVGRSAGNPSPYEFENRVCSPPTGTRSWDLIGMVGGRESLL